MRSIFAGLLLLIAVVLLPQGAHAQAQLVYCDVSIAAYCTPTANPGVGTQGDPAWQAFGKVNSNFEFLGALWALPANSLIGSQGVGTLGTITIGANLSLTGGVLSATGGGGSCSGTCVTNFSIVTANGFSGSVANAMTTPALTLTTSITGPLKGNGTAIQAAAASDVYDLFGCSGVATTFLNGAGGCTTPAGGGNVSAGGTPTQYQTPVWSASTVLLGVGPGTTGQVLTSGGASAYPSYSSTPPLVGTNFTGTASALSIGGNAATATALATTPAQCSGAAVANGITASGVANCVGGQTSISSTYTLLLGDQQKQIYDTDTSANTITIPANSSVAYPVATCVQFYNDPTGGVVTIAINTDTLTLSPPVGASPTGSRTLAAGGVATACKYTTTKWWITGAGLTMLIEPRSLIDQRLDAANDASFGVRRAA